MTLKELKSCFSQIPEEFDDVEVIFEERKVGYRYHHETKRVSYGEYDTNRKFAHISNR